MSKYLLSMGAKKVVSVVKATNIENERELLSSCDDKHRKLTVITLLSRGFRTMTWGEHRGYDRPKSNVLESQTALEGAIEH